MMPTFPAAIGCETPQVLNGKVHELQSTYDAGETLHFDCDAGYAAEDTYETQCQPGGTWDPPLLICERGECGCPLRPRGQPCPAGAPGSRNSVARLGRSCDGL